ncbi:hypothetical protein C7R94_21865 [Brevibacillus sp. NRRL NRS-603]|nr:hypothetical protein C7R94_21865 [Brevibacillus sp. NRRL NRS-603]
MLAKTYLRRDSMKALLLKLRHTTAIVLAFALLFNTVLLSTASANTQINKIAKIDSEVLKQMINSKYLEDADVELNLSEDELRYSTEFVFTHLEYILFALQEDQEYRELFMNQSTINDDLKEELESVLEIKNEEKKSEKLYSLVDQIREDIEEEINANELSPTILPSITSVVLKYGSENINEPRSETIQYSSGDKVEALALPLLWPVVALALKGFVKSKFGKKIMREIWDEFEDRVWDEISNAAEAVYDERNGKIDYSGPENSNGRIKQGEEVFTLYDDRGRDIFRFDIRKRELRGKTHLDFHYHKKTDSDPDMEEHYEIYTITRNGTLPKWGTD